MVEFLVDQALREAIDLQNRNQLDEAKSIYKKIIDHDAKNSDAAKVNPNKLCTSFAHTLKISNQPHFFSLLGVGAKSLL